VFDALHRRGTVREAMLYAFDLLELDGEDLWRRQRFLAPSGAVCF
jgi:ATP-dependent DNA ligase